MRRLREWVAGELRTTGPARRSVAGAHHDRLAAGAGPDRQGADRRGQHACSSSRRPTSARCRPSCRWSRVSPAWRAMTKGRCRTRWRPLRRGRRCALLLPAAELPEPDRAQHERGAPRGARRARRRRSACRWSRTTPMATSGSTPRRRRAWPGATPRARSTWARSPRCWRPACAWATWSRRPA